MRIKKLVCLFVVVIVLSVILPSVSAATINNGDIANPSSYQPVCFNEYSTMVWPTLAKAKEYYGYDFSYHSCSHYYNGQYYNYYYDFSNGSKMYFFVSLDDGNDVWSVPEYESELK